MHDSITGERLGVPAVAIMTDRFVSAAERMARVLGAVGYPFVVVAHPISSATGRELASAAARAADECVVRLTSGEQPRADD